MKQHHWQPAQSVILMLSVQNYRSNTHTLARSCVNYGTWPTAKTVFSSKHGTFLNKKVPLGFLFCNFLYIGFSIVQSNIRRWQITIFCNCQYTLLTVDLWKYKTYSQNVNNDEFSVHFLIIFTIALLFGETQFEFSSLLIKSRSACRCFSSTKKQLKCEEKALEANMKACILLKVHWHETVMKTGLRLVLHRVLAIQ